MGLLDEIAEESRPPAPRCLVAAVLDDLPPDERGDLEAALADHVAYAHTAITRVLKRRGYEMHEKRVAAHRKGSCACAR
jgi:anti-sigma factor RsiW